MYTHQQGMIAIICRRWSITSLNILPQVLEQLFHCLSYCSFAHVGLLGKTTHWWHAPHAQRWAAFENYVCPTEFIPQVLIISPLSYTGYAFRSYLRLCWLWNSTYLLGHLTGKRFTSRRRGSRDRIFAVHLQWDYYPLYQSNLCQDASFTDVPQAWGGTIYLVRFA